jgi:ubiquinone/menaquinone biosynthesis C-methylase UbiE
MNRLENWFCASWLWRRMTRRQLVPWLLQGAELGEHVLELGAGPGATTEELRRRAGRVTSVEYSHEFAMQLVRRDFLQSGASSGKNESASEPTGGDAANAWSHGGKNGAIVQGDASVLPFPAKTFSAVTAVLVLHHLRSREAQERAFAEAFRVLRPGGVLLGVEIPDGWIHRTVHIRSTFVPVTPESAPTRLEAAGFSHVDIEFRSGAFRIRAERAA